MPGLVADRYADTLVVKLYTRAWTPHLPEVLNALLHQQPAERVILRLSRAVQRSPVLGYGLADGRTLFGTPADGPVIFRENGLMFEADPVHGQKTGFFLDQRENRARVEAVAAGKKVLNVFAYSGGFSLYAARGGATAVTSLDISAPALEVARRNFARNGQLPAIAAARHVTMAADAFQALASMVEDGVRFDVVILDPPSFAKQKSEVEHALGAYRRLVELGLGIVVAGGILISASCSSRVPADTFFAHVLDVGRLQGRPLTEIARTEHPLDHPVNFPEGAYLKCLFAKAP